MELIKFTSINISKKCKNYTTKTNHLQSENVIDIKLVSMKTPNRGVTFESIGIISETIIIKIEIVKKQSMANPFLSPVSSGKAKMKSA